MSITFTLILASGSRAQNSPVRIAVVKTWEELLAVKPLDLGDGVRVRLGLEADKVARWSGALIYCLAEGHLPSNSSKGNSPLGPVQAKVKFANEIQAEAEHAAKIFDRGNVDQPKGTYLYVSSFAIDRVGTYFISISKEKGVSLATATVAGTDDFFHPWTPFLIRSAAPEIPGEGIGLPTEDGLSPVVALKVGEKKHGHLPTFLPSDEKPGLSIRKVDKEIDISSRTEFTTSRPDYHFLARWWVNGKPYVPKQTEHFWCFAGYGRVTEGRDLRREWTFYPERIGARPGDKVGLQLMHCEGRWDWCGNEGHLMKIGRDRKRENVRVSNRIEFHVVK